MREKVEVRVVLVDGEGAGVGVAVSREGDGLADIGRPLHGAIGIEAESKVIEGVGICSRFCPRAEAEICNGGRTGRVQDFGVVGVPLGEACVYNHAIGDGRVGRALRGEDDMPKADNGDAIFALVILRCQGGGFDRGAEWDGSG